MRPLTLDIEGLRSFRAPQRIDFTGRDHVAIVGDTGAGKSSILEALTFALYGRTTFTSQGNQELMNATATAMRVVLRFAVGGQRWEVARTLRRSGKGAVGGAMAVLHRLGDGDGGGGGDEPVEAHEGVRPVNTRIEELLGLDAEAFLRAVVLPQGQFARLLVDDDQRERAAVLRQIWRTDELVAAGAAADAALAELAPLRGRVEQALAAEPDDPDAHLAALEAEASSAAAEAEAVAGRLAALRDLAERRDAALRRAADLASLADGLDGWDAGAAAAEAARLAEATAALDAEAAADADAIAAVEARLAAVPDDGDGLTYEQVVEVDTALSVLPQLLDDLAIAEASDAEAAADLVDAQEAVQRERAAASDAEAAAVEAEEGRTSLVAAVDAAAEAGRLAAARLAAARQARAEVAERRAEVAATEAALAEAGEVADEAAAAAVAAGAALDAAVRADAAAAAAHGLHAGDACPVCDRDLPGGWSAPAGTDLGPLRAAAERTAARAADTASDRRVVADRLRRAAELLATAEDRLAAYNDLDLDGDDTELLAPLDDALAGARAALAAHDEAVAALRGQASAAAAASAAAGAELLAAERRRRECANRRGDLAARSRAALDALPGGWRPDGAGDVDGMRRSLAERRATLEDRRARRQACSDELARLRGRASERERTRLGVDTGAARLAAELDDVGRRVAATAEQAGLAVATATTDPGPPPAGDPAALAPAVAAVAAAVEAALGGLSERSAAAEDEARRAADELGDTDLDAVAAEADEARFRARTAQAAAERFAGRVKAIRSVREAGERLDAAHANLADLAAALKPGAFPKWLTLRRSRDLLVHASRVLGEMSGGRYAFAELADDQSDWLVVDADNGMARSPASLSGGEKFVASLALALGMVEMMARSGGRLEALFLDEGFGALDRDNLDAAVAALASAASSGRMVATISHVRAVAEQVEHVLSVTRGPAGTEVRWLDAAERRALALDDVTGDPALHRLLA